MLVLNNQLPQRTERDPSGNLAVHSVFPTIQGEGPFAGQAALFIRLHGCNLQCPGCDTEYTSVRKMTSPVDLAASVAMMRDPGDLVVITGGEPFRQNITPAVWELLGMKFRVQIETNGTLLPPMWDPNGPIGNGFPYHLTTVICSPKTARIHPNARNVHAFKYVLSAGYVDPADGLPTIALAHDIGRAEHVARPPRNFTGTIYLQPMDVKDEDENMRNVLACVDSVMRFKKYTLGFQMHKYINLP